MTSLLLFFYAMGMLQMTALVGVYYEELEGHNFIINMVILLWPLVMIIVFFHLVAALFQTNTGE